LTITGATNKLVTELGAEITYDGTENATVTEETGLSFKVKFGAEDKVVLIDTDTRDLDEDGEYARTTFGTEITFGGVETKVVYPDKRIVAEVVAGEIKAPEIVEVYKEVIEPIKAPLAKLDTEIVDPTALDRNVILVGGSCANALVQRLVDEGALAEEYGCPGGVPGAAWTPGKGYIIAVEDAYGSGKIAIVAAGATADDTRVVAAALQRYDEFLTEEKIGEATLVEVTGTVVAPVITVPA
jgi:hypothetical protein